MLSIQNVTYSYGDKEILHDITATVNDGDFCAILGPNGCGKTTLLRCIANLTKPKEGYISINDTPVSTLSPRIMAQNIAFVMQHPQTDIDFSAFETVLMGRNPYQRRLQNESEQDWSIVEQCMRQTNTWHLRLSIPSQMSGGELQRVMIARALAQQTPILLLDEPTSNLDIAHQFEIMELLRDINRKEGKTILIVVHDLNLALRYCPKTMLLHDTKLIYKGPTRDALTPERIHEVFDVEASIVDDYLKIDKV